MHEIHLPFPHSPFFLPFSYSPFTPPFTFPFSSPRPHSPLTSPESRCLMKQNLISAVDKILVFIINAIHSMTERDGSSRMLIYLHCTCSALLILVLFSVTGFDKLPCVCCRPTITKNEQNYLQLIAYWLPKPPMSFCHSWARYSGNVTFRG